MAISDSSECVKTQPLTEESPLKSTKDEAPDDDGGSWSSSFGLVCSCLGCALGMGNVWRFPRIVAQNTGDHGCLAFIMAWLLFLFVWSIPMLLIEYGMGRGMRKGVIQSFQRLAGPRYTWCGLWVTLVNFAIGCYLSVIMGWCIFYLFHTCIHPLPSTEQKSLELFTGFAQESYWPVFLHAVSVSVTLGCLVGGVTTIERANQVLTPAFAVMLAVLFTWSLTRPHAMEGLRFLFSLDAVQFLDPHLWLDAASQNAYDTCAGTGVFVSMAAFMTQRHPAVKYAIIIPIINNVVSLMCGILTFTTAFSTLRDGDVDITNRQIVSILQRSGPGSTGLTFIWLPVLFAAAGIAGRVLAAMFFTCLFCAALSSYIAYVEIVVRSLEDFSVPRKYGVPLTGLANFVCGLGSSLNLSYLSNQDYTWGIGVMINGLMFLAVVILTGVTHFRERYLNNICPSDWKVPAVWDYIIKFVAPFEAVLLLIWWMAYCIYDDDSTDDGYHWYELGPRTLLTVMVQWLGVLMLLLVSNAVLLKVKPDWLTPDTAVRDVATIKAGYTELEDSPGVEPGSPGLESPTDTLSQ